MVAILRLPGVLLTLTAAILVAMAVRVSAADIEVAGTTS